MGNRQHQHRLPGDARDVALEVLLAIETRGAFLQPALEGAARRADLDSRDRALALELVSGVERWRARLDWSLDRLIRRGLGSTSEPVRWILRIGAYQLLMLDRIPARAATHTAVRHARERVGEGAAKLTNAVLRALARNAETLPTGSAVEAIAVRASHPEWLVRDWIDRHGSDFAEALCQGNNLAAPLTARITSRCNDRARMLDRLRESGAQIEMGRYAPDAMNLAGLSRPFESEAFVGGEWIAQDEAAQLVVCLLNPRPGEAIWDACAAPGGKTRAISELIGNAGIVWATDAHARKSRTLADHLRDCPNVTVVRHDAREPPDPELMPVDPRSPGFDGVLVDAPCTGLGLLRRHPEIRWRRTSDDVEASATRQAAILDGACRAVRPGGRIVYSVCSPSHEEGPEIIARFLERNHEFCVEPPSDTSPVDWSAITTDGCLRTWPHLHGTDGFFAARMRRKLTAESPE